MKSKDPAPSRNEIDGVLQFLSILAAPDFVPGTPAGGERLESGARQMPWFRYSSETNAFVQALYDNGWICDFDWPAWAGVAERYVKEPSLLHDAGFDTIRQILTTHVRMNRFSEGHLAAVERSGHLVAVLRRLQKLREECNTDSPEELVVSIQLFRSGRDQ